MHECFTIYLFTVHWTHCQTIRLNIIQTFNILIMCHLNKCLHLKKQKKGQSESTFSFERFPCFSCLHWWSTHWTDCTDMLCRSLFLAYWGTWWFCQIHVSFISFVQLNMSKPSFCRTEDLFRLYGRYLV